MIAGIAFVAVTALAFVTVFSFAHARSSRMSEQEFKSSNARVLREFERMAVYHPEKIVDYSERSHRHADAR